MENMIKVSTIACSAEHTAISTDSGQALSVLPNIEKIQVLKFLSFRAKHYTAFVTVHCIEIEITL